MRSSCAVMATKSALARSTARKASTAAASSRSTSRSRIKPDVRRPAPSAPGGRELGFREQRVVPTDDPPDGSSTPPENGRTRYRIARRSTQAVESGWQCCVRAPPPTLATGLAQHLRKRCTSHGLNCGCSPSGPRQTTTHASPSAVQIVPQRAAAGLPNVARVPRTDRGRSQAELRRLAAGATTTSPTEVGVGSLQSLHGAGGAIGVLLEHKAHHISGAMNSAPPSAPSWTIATASPRPSAPRIT